MTRRAEAVIAALEDLPPDEREEVLAEILRRVALANHSAPSDDELVAAADQVFQALDRHEDAGH